MQPYPQDPDAAVCQTDCFIGQLIQDLGERRVVADFPGSQLSSDGGALLLRQIDAGLGVTRALAGCFVDRRDPELIDHRVQELLAQRIDARALGHEGLNDHPHLRRDPLLTAAAGKTDVLGGQRRCSEHRGSALASPATLIRLELGSQHAECVCVTSAAVQDGNGAVSLLTRLYLLFGRLQIIRADGGSAGAPVERVKGLRPFGKLHLEIVRRSNDAKCFQLLRRRWIVGRTFRWLDKSRRVSRDYEQRIDHPESHIYVCMCRLMIKRIASH